MLKSKNDRNNTNIIIPDFNKTIGAFVRKLFASFSRLAF